MTGNLGSDNPCPYCDYNATSPKRMEQHLNRRIPGEAYFCDICDKKWCVKLGMLHHKSKAHKIETKPREEPHEVTKFICEVCDFVAKTRFSLKKHLSTKHKDYDMDNIPTYSKVKKDDENSEEVKKVLCDKMGNINVPDSDSDIPDFDPEPEISVTKFKKENVQDDDQDDDRKKYHYIQCQYCDYSAQNRDRLDNHLKLRKKGQSFSCKFCPKKWCNRKGVATHMQKSHQKVYKKRPKVKKTSRSFKKNIKCQFCDLVTSQRGISNHMRNKEKNSGTELKVCDICGFKSCTQKLLDRHKIVEHLVYPVKKNKSGYRSKTTRSDPFSCKDCDYTTKVFKFYKRHLTYKKEDKNIILYKCKCGMKLCSEGAFLTHRYLKHNNKKPTSEIHRQKVLRSAVDQSNSKNDSSIGPSSMKSNLCEKILESKEKLHFHIRKKHGGIKWEKLFCKYCPFSTKYKSSLIRHIHRQHDDEDDMDVMEDESSNEDHEETLNVKIYNVLPKPVKGIWIVVLEKLEE